MSLITEIQTFVDGQLLESEVDNFTEINNIVIKLENKDSIMIDFTHDCCEHSWFEIGDIKSIIGNTYKDCGSELKIDLANNNDYTHTITHCYIEFENGNKFYFKLHCESNGYYQSQLEVRQMMRKEYYPDPSNKLIFIIGLPGSGKTTYLHQLVRTYKNNNKHVYFYDDEMLNFIDIEEIFQHVKDATVIITHPNLCRFLQCKTLCDEFEINPDNIQIICFKKNVKNSKKNCIKRTGTNKGKIINGLFNDIDRLAQEYNIDLYKQLSNNITILPTDLY